MSHGTGRIAKRYAKALFEATNPQGLEAMRDALIQLASIWSSTMEIRAAVLNPSLTAEVRQRVAGEIANAVKSGDKEFSNFISILVENKRAAAIPEIAQQFSAMFDELKAALSLEITSAFEVSSDERSKYEQKIRQDFGSLAKIEWKLDAELIGGMVIKSGDRLIDSSIKGSLQKMAAQLLA